MPTANRHTMGGCPIPAGAMIIRPDDTNTVLRVIDALKGRTDPLGQTTRRLAQLFAPHRDVTFHRHTIERAWPGYTEPEWQDIDDDLLDRHRATFAAAWHLLIELLLRPKDEPEAGLSSKEISLARALSERARLLTATEQGGGTAGLNLADMIYLYGLNTLIRPISGTATIITHANLLAEMLRLFEVSDLPGQHPDRKRIEANVSTAWQALEVLTEPPAPAGPLGEMGVAAA